jgi:hypothetical protein
MDQSTREQYLKILKASFTAYNKSYFEFDLRPLPIRFGSPRSSKDYGSYEDKEIIIRASLLTGKHPQTQFGHEHQSGRLLFVKDVLLHQKAHQFCIERLNRPEKTYDGHTAPRTVICVIGSARRSAFRWYGPASVARR